MKVSLSWLKEYVTVTLPPHELADALTMAGLEVEEVADRYAHLDGVRVGRIAEVTPHPRADRLKLCKVEIGEAAPVQVVCGAPNAKAGMPAPLALPGTVFPDGTRLEATSIRGETSHGMLCSAGELGLGPDRSGLMALDPDLTVGEKLAPALDLSDVVFEIGLTPNRPDCLSIIGVAREVAAIEGGRLTYPQIELPLSEPHNFEFSPVTIEAPDLCPRYAARVLDEIAVGPSPEWLRERLLSVGLKPINNIVDVTNFVMMEMGQPLHAFDYDRLAENRIVVRTAGEGERFHTLDGKERVLTADMLMICDGEKPVAVGGVMGGMNSEIGETTTRVLIESAYFDPVSIRKTSKKLGLATDASHRFERGVDPERTVVALNRAAQLMTQAAGGRMLDGLIDQRPKRIEARRITFGVAAANRLLGTDLDRGRMEALLKSIEFTVESGAGDEVAVRPPSFRVDITRPEDLMEEVARLWGYDNIATTHPLIRAEGRKPPRSLEIRRRIRNLLTGFGFTETINYSFIHRGACEIMRLDAGDPMRRMLDILNPLSEEQAVMRTSLLPGLLGTMGRNLARQVRTLRIFEVGKTFTSRGTEDLPAEREVAAGLWTGSRGDASWTAKETPCDFYDIKGVVEGLLWGLGIRNAAFTRRSEAECRYARPGVAATITGEGRTLGMVGEVHPKVVEGFDLKQPAFIFELDLEALGALAPEVRRYRELPRYPAVTRDITLIVDRGAEARRIEETIREAAAADPLEEIQVFDAYEGGAIAPGKKSLSFRLIYRSPEATLEDEQVNAVHKRIADRLLDRFEATLPT